MIIELSSIIYHYYWIQYNFMKDTFFSCYCYKKKVDFTKTVINSKYYRLKDKIS